MTWKKLISGYRDFIIIFVTPLLLMPLPILVDDQKGTCGYMLILMGVYWCTECLPLGVTGLIPVFLSPLFGILTTVQVCENYLKDNTMMFTGGLFVAIALEKSNLHRRIAIAVLRLVGTEPKWLMFGFMLTTSFLSMWISNTATAAMVFPILEAVLGQLKETHGRSVSAFDDADIPLSSNDMSSEIESKQKEDLEESNDPENNANNSLTDNEENDETPEFKHLCRGLTLAVAYASSVGGNATLTGTAPNPILKGHSDKIWFEHGLGESSLTYTSWMVYAVPQAVINFFFVYFWLQLYYLGIRSFTCKSTVDEEQKHAVKSVLKQEYDKLGPVRYAESAVAVMFAILVLLWFFRSPGFMKGWGDYFKQGYIGDAVPAIFIATLMFCIPNEIPDPRKKTSTRKVDALLDWPFVHKKFPWSIIFLMGGGFALAEACEESGLSEWIGDQLAVFGKLPGWLMVAIICLLVSFLTEVTSNAATCTILMPIVASMAETLGMNPLYLMMPTTVATSFAFMLPAATPPNAIAFSYGRITVMDMVKAGFVLNFLCVISVTLATQFWCYDYFDFDTIPWEDIVANLTTENSLVT